MFDTSPQLDCAGRIVKLDCPRIMGIVNVTPDSFSDHGAHFDAEVAFAHGLRLAEEGADILDVGGESTRPGADAIPLEEEMRRVIPVIERLAKETSLPISIDTSKPEVMRAAVAAGACMINDVYALDASSEPADKPQTEFYCGTPVVMLTFSNLPPGKYGLTILQATGVPKPQQISLILSESSGNRWMLAGFLNRPMVEAGHDGLWYWEQARQYAAKSMKWNAWFYYQAAAYLLNPAEFLSSPNLQKLKREMDATRPPSLPGPKPLMLDANGSAFEITAVGTTTEFGGLDLEVNYTPNAAQLAQLRDPVAARTQVIAVMNALVMAYPELRSAFRGIWVRANQGNASIFALDLPMNQIAAAGSGPAAGAGE